MMLFFLLAVDILVRYRLTGGTGAASARRRSRPCRAEPCARTDSGRGAAA